MIAILAALAMTTPSPTALGVEDFFPLEPGTAWEYREQGRLSGASYRDEVKEPVEIDGKLAWPIVSSERGKEFVRTYYRIENQAVYIVAYDPKKPLSTPQPVIKFGPGRTKWEYSGESTFIHDPVLLTMRAECGLKGKREILGQQVELLEVKLEGVLGGQAGTSVESKQVAYYAKGIGLVEMLSDNRVGTERSKTQLKLVKFEPAKPRL